MQIMSAVLTQPGKELKNTKDRQLETTKESNLIRSRMTSSKVFIEILRKYGNKFDCLIFKMSFVINTDQTV